MNIGLKIFLTTCLAVASMSSCGKEFVGLGTRKKTERKPSISPPESESVRKEPERPMPKEEFPSEPKLLPQGISLHVVAMDSESWWKNCLYARTPYGGDWVLVSCNKGAGPGTVTLAGMQGTCTDIEIRMDIFKNLGETCNLNAKNGLPCNGPYANAPDWSVTPNLTVNAEHEPSQFSLLDLGNISTPDPLIRPNGGWTLPNFEQLHQEMSQWKKKGFGNEWFRVFFEDQPSHKIRDAETYASDAWTLGVDYNDYVFDIKTENLDIGIKGALGPQSCN